MHVEMLVCTGKRCLKVYSVEVSNHLVHSSQVILSTACTCINGTNGKCIQAKALVDYGPQSSFITQHLLDQLSLPCIPANTSIVGINSFPLPFHKRCTIQIKSNTSSYILESISDNISVELFSWQMRSCTRQGALICCWEQK